MGRMCVDTREYVYDVAHDKGCQVARARVGDLGSHRGEDAHDQRIRQCSGC